ncbi:MAG TPA: ribonucleotide-diphosphate reductase subunit beta [Elusimicrobiota bacterium]|jgi:ribonucleoside-diphosphate reductase subunit M2|nr:ribonucleotide-diphosphate reductase subunit beta [Elusimicrobiota bacterium]
MASPVAERDLSSPPERAPAPEPAPEFAGKFSAPGDRKSPFRWHALEADRASLFPILHPDIWEFRKKMERCRWTAKDVSLSRDRQQWEALDADVRHTVGMQLAFFSQIDGLVLSNLSRFGAEVDCLEARMAYSAQEDQECVHMESYNLQIEAVIADGGERKRMLEAARHLPIVGDMHAWVTAAFRKHLPLGERLVAAAFTEGVLFCASFAIMQWLRELNRLPGVTEVNSYIARDENIHTEYSCHLVRDRLQAPVPAGKVHRIFADAMEVAERFVDQSLPVALTGLNATLMRQYVHFQADATLFLLGAGHVYRAPNPFSSMDKLALNRISKSNFFEERATQYQSLDDSGSSALRLAPALVSED